VNAFVIARNTLGDALRKRVLLVFLLLALVFLFLALMLNYFTAREQMSMFMSMSTFVLLIFGAMIAITTAVFLIPNEIENRTIHSVLSKPVRRWEFFLGKFFGGVLTLGVSLGLISLIVVIVVALLSLKAPTGADPTQVLTQAQQQFNAAEWWDRASVSGALVIRSSLVIFFELVLLTAIATTLSLFLSATVNFSLTAFIFIAGSLQDVVAAWGRRNEELALVPYIAQAFYYVMPHFQDFNIMGNITHPEVPIAVNHLTYAGLVSVYGLLYAAVVLLLGIVVFDGKEV